MFCDELIAAYPSAKVILSIREEDSWIKSVESTIWHNYVADQAAGKKPETPRDIMLHKMLGYAFEGDFPKNGRKVFRDHNEHVRQLMKDRKEDFLEYNIKEGWGPLCQFLGKEMPKEDIPHTDVWAKYKEKGKWDDQQ
jgi:hypothetical protein